MWLLTIHGFVLFRTRVVRYIGEPICLSLLVTATVWQTSRMYVRSRPSCRRSKKL